MSEKHFFSIFEELKLFQFKESNLLEVTQYALLLRYWSFLGFWRAFFAANIPFKQFERR